MTDLRRRRMTIPIPYDRPRSEGVWIGLRMALDILTREMARQEHRGRVAQAENPLEYTAAQHVYAAHVLNDAAKQVGAEFRRGAA
jgi:hypothetical protein